MKQTRESMEFDVVIVGAGPSGLATSIKLAQLAKKNNQQLNICILEKGAEVGSHIISGAIFEPRALDELIPNWQELNAPLNTPVTKDSFMYLTKSKAIPLPVPPSMHNKGNYIISLGELCRWLGQYAESLGIQIFPGFAASEVLYDQNNKVIGVATNDLGIDKNNKQKSSYQPGMELHAKYTVFAEGCRGSLSKQVMKKFNLQANCEPQAYGIGIKEIWKIPDELHKPGNTLHAIGWPLDHKTYGGTFLYHLKPNLLVTGIVIGLDYENPYLNPFEELQRFKHHPKIKHLFINSKRISYGARAISEGGAQSIPQLHFPGGLLVGDTAGFLNVPKIKGSHTAMKSGMIAAENIYKALSNNSTKIISNYDQDIKKSWLYKELFKVRNIRPSFKYGLIWGVAYSALDTYIFHGKTPWTFRHHADHEALKPAVKYKPISYPKPDNKISFDKLSSVNLSNTFHEEDQPIHLQLTDQNIPITVNLKLYDAPEQRYCPAGVYEIIKVEGKEPYLQINAQNCVHCKTCDIKDPKQNITWVTPEGGGGPNYSNM